MADRNQRLTVDAQGMGIFCLTPDNLIAPWLAFEAGAISVHDRGRVATFLLNVEPSSLHAPLSLFQATSSHQKSDVYSLLKSINSRLAEPLELSLLENAFDTSWDGLAIKLKEIGESKDAVKIAQLNPNEILEEILRTVRRLEKDAAEVAEMRRDEASSREISFGAVRRNANSHSDIFGKSDKSISVTSRLSEGVLRGLADNQVRSQTIAELARRGVSLDAHAAAPEFARLRENLANTVSASIANAEEFDQLKRNIEGVAATVPKPEKGQKSE